jgi:hypothetical protein
MALGALLQHGQHGNVAVIFAAPTNGSVLPLQLPRTLVTVQVHVLNMWFEGACPALQCKTPK